MLEVHAPQNGVAEVNTRKVQPSENTIAQIGSEHIGHERNIALVIPLNSLKCFDLPVLVFNLFFQQNDSLEKVRIITRHIIIIFVRQAA